MSEMRYAVTISEQKRGRWRTTEWQVEVSSDQLCITFTMPTLDQAVSAAQKYISRLEAEPSNARTEWITHRG